MCLEELLLRLIQSESGQTLGVESLILRCLLELQLLNSHIVIMIRLKLDAYVGFNFP